MTIDYAAIAGDLHHCGTFYCLAQRTCKDTKKYAHLQTFPQKNCTFVIFLVDECHCIHNSNLSSLSTAVCYHSRYSFGIPSIFLRLNSAHSRSTNCAIWSVQSAQELKKTAKAVFSEPLAGLEPATHALRMRCSTN